MASSTWETDKWKYLNALKGNPYGGIGMLLAAAMDRDKDRRQREMYDKTHASQQEASSPIVNAMQGQTKKEYPTSVPEGGWNTDNVNPAINPMSDVNQQIIENKRKYAEAMANNDEQGMLAANAANEELRKKTPADQLLVSNRTATSGSLDNALQEQKALQDLNAGKTWQNFATGQGFYSNLANGITPNNNLAGMQNTVTVPTMAQAVSNNSFQLPQINGNMLRNAPTIDSQQAMANKNANFQTGGVKLFNR